MSEADIATGIARYACTLDAASIPGPVRHCVQHRLLDSLACVLGAYDAPPVLKASRVAEQFPGDEASLFGIPATTNAEMAAFVNGVMVRFLDYNDGYMGKEPGHPSDQIPACIAVAQMTQAPMSEFITAVVIAYEVQMRLQDAASLNRRGWDQACYILVSCAAATARLMRLTVEETAQAINLALNGHIPLRQVRSGTLSDWKGCSAANAARNAVFAARLAKAGMTGPAPIFEGRMGLFEQVTGPFDLEVDSFGNAVNQDFAILRSLTKAFPTNGELHTAVWAALAIRRRLPDLGAIASILIETSEFNCRVLADEEKWRPQTRETADHSLPYNVARGLIDGDITLASYTPEAIGDPQVAELMRKTAVAEDRKLTAMFPDYLANRVSVTLEDGTRLVEEVHTGPGGREHPMSASDFIEKFRKMAAPWLTVLAQDDAVRFVLELERQDDFSGLFRAMTARRPGRLSR